MNTAVTTTPLAHSVQATCIRLGVGRVTLYKLLGSGQLKSFQVGNKRLIPEAELQRFIAEQLAADKVAR